MAINLTDEQIGDILDKCEAVVKIKKQLPPMPTGLKASYPGVREETIQELRALLDAHAEVLVDLAVAMGPYFAQIPSVESPKS